MALSPRLVAPPARQPLVETLLLEVRDEYLRAVKRAVVDFRRGHTAAARRLFAPLRLPPPPPPPGQRAVPASGVVAVPPHALSLARVRQLVASTHYAVFPRCTAVVLELQRAWSAVEGLEFLRTPALPAAAEAAVGSDAGAASRDAAAAAAIAAIVGEGGGRGYSSGAMQLPLPLPEFLAMQADHFALQRDKVHAWLGCASVGQWMRLAYAISLANTASARVHVQLVVDWRSLVVNRIRDTLAGTFNLFVTDVAQFRGSPLERFVKLVGFMLRAQLAELAERSVRRFVRFIHTYELPEQPKGDEASAATVAPAQPLFVCTMEVAASGRVEFAPPLEELAGALAQLLDVPAQLDALTEVLWGAMGR